MPTLAPLVVENNVLVSICKYKIICISSDCGYIGSPENGDVHVTNGSTTYGSVLDFTCEAGHELQGSNSTTCLENGSWSNAIPVCGIRGQAKII